jgi:hypothetical protein
MLDCGAGSGAGIDVTGVVVIEDSLQRRIRDAAEGITSRPLEKYHT